MRTHPLHSILSTFFAASFTLASCDLTDDPPPCAGAECDDKAGDDEGDDDEGEEEESGEASDEAPPADTAAPPHVPEECAALCACVVGLGGNEGACGQQCSADMNDEDPNDRAQCVEGLAEAGFADCSVECDTLPDGT